MDPDGLILREIRLERTVSSIMRKGIKKNAYVFNNKLPAGEVIVRCPQCNRDAIGTKIYQKSRDEIYLDRKYAQASVSSAIKRSAGSVKAGLCHSVVLRMELERNGVSRRGALQKRDISIKIDM